MKIVIIHLPACLFTRIHYLHPPQCKDAFSTYIYALIWMKMANPCVEADAEVCVGWVICKMALQEREDCIFFAYKKYSRRFIKFRLNHWWQVDFPGDAFHYFLDLNRGFYLAVNGTILSLPIFLLNILNCVLKTNKAFMELKRHAGKWKTTFSFWGGE